jgi:hypothetical protein
VDFVKQFLLRANANTNTDGRPDSADAQREELLGKGVRSGASGKLQRRGSVTQSPVRRGSVSGGVGGGARRGSISPASNRPLSAPAKSSNVCALFVPPEELVFLEPVLDKAAVRALLEPSHFSDEKALHLGEKYRCELPNP